MVAVALATRVSGAVGPVFYGDGAGVAVLLSLGSLLLGIKDLHIRGPVVGLEG